MAVMINESEWKKIDAEHKATKAKLDAVISHAPECWGEDLDAEEFVLSLLGEGTIVPGHTDDCDCWE